MDRVPKLVDKKCLCDVFVYSKSRERSGKIHWDCNRLRARECKGRAVTVKSGDEIIILRVPKQSPHGHPPNREEGIYVYLHIYFNL